MVYPSLKLQILFHSNGPAIWHGLTHVRHIKINNGRESAILNFMEQKCFFVHPSMTSHIYFYSNGLAIRHSFPNKTHIWINNGNKSAIF